MVAEGIRYRGGKYSFRVNAKDENGERVPIERGGFKTEKEAKKARILMLAEIEKQGGIKKKSKVKVDEVYRTFVDKEAKYDREKSTLRRYDSVYRNHIQPKWGKREIAGVKPEEVTEYFYSKTSELSDSYISSIHKIARVIWDYAVRQGEIEDNTMDKVKLPRKKIKEKEEKVYTKEQLKAMEERFKSTNLITAFYLCRDLGVRVGECFGLCWRDIDWKKRTIKVNKQLAQEDKMWTIKGPKTQASIREIQIPNGLYEYLKDLKVEQDKAREKLGIAYRGNRVAINRGRNKKVEVVKNLDLINIKPNGELLTTDSAKMLSKIARQELGIDFKPHNLRHTHASMLAEMNVPAVAVKERLGHSKIDTTMGYYTHVTEGMRDQLSEAINTY